MPRKTAYKCYFGCIPYKGKVHRFPPQLYPHTEKFDQWKMVLSEIDRERGDSYICNNIRICDHHFEEFYRTPTGYLTKNAVPTLNIETQAFTREFGADIVLNHTQDLIPQLEANGFGAGVDFILVNFDPAPYWDTLMKAIKPGRICLIVDSSSPLDITILKDKSITLVTESMFTRVKYNTEDKIRQYEIFKQLSKWLEEGKLKSTLTKTMAPINAANLREAHKMIEDKKMIGKLVLSEF